MLGYMAFETSNDPTLLFSAGHIRKLCVQDAMDLEIPQSCSGEFTLLQWSNEVHNEDMLCVGELRSHVPSLDEIRPILTDAAAQYGLYGKRSVRVRFRGRECAYMIVSLFIFRSGIEYPLHFRDVRRWSNIHHLRGRIEKVRRVLRTITDVDLLTPEEYDVIVQERFDRPLCGFRPDLNVTLFHLHELLGENWLGERLIDGILNIFERQLNSRTPDLIRILDCSFHMELGNCYRARRASPLLIRLREEFLRDSPIIVAFLLNKHDCHWAPTATVMDIRFVLQGDSGPFPYDEDFRAMVHWWLQDIVEEDGEWDERQLPVESQDARSGSCGLASISAVATFAQHMESVLKDYSSPRLSFALWTNRESRNVRNNWIQVILRNHLATRGSAMVCFFVQHHFLLLC
jgi:hypothetical protein